MKNLLLTAIGFCWIGNITLSGAKPSSPAQYKADPNLRVAELVNLSRKDVEKLTGHKMSLVERISFVALKARMRKAVKKDPAITFHSFMASQKKNAGVVVLFVILGVILLVFILFVALYTDFKK
jgi:hypothetical protein